MQFAIDQAAQADQEQDQQRLQFLKSVESYIADAFAN